MDRPLRTDHVVCDTFRRFLLTALKSTATHSCTCLADNGASLSQKYPDFAILLRAVCRDAEAFLQGLPVAYHAQSERELVPSLINGTVGEEEQGQRDDERSVTNSEPLPNQAKDRSVLRPVPLPDNLQQGARNYTTYISQ